MSEKRKRLWSASAPRSGLAGPSATAWRVRACTCLLPGAPRPGWINSVRSIQTKAEPRPGWVTDTTREPDVLACLIAPKTRPTAGWTAWCITPGNTFPKPLLETEARVL